MSKAATAIMIIAALALAACGRAGPLEPPPSSVAGAPAQPGQDDAPDDDRPFVLDGLLQ